MGKTSLVRHCLKGHWSIFSQPKQPLLFSNNTKNFLCVANFLQALFKPQHWMQTPWSIAIMLKIWNAKMFWKKTLPSSYKSRTNRYFKIYQRVRWLPMAVIKWAILVVFSLQTKKSLFNNYLTWFKKIVRCLNAIDTGKKTTNRFIVTVDFACFFKRNNSSNAI